MTIAEMHYDAKTKLNAVDSAKYRGFKIPELDWKLNEAANIILNSAFPRVNQGYGLEVNSRAIANFRPFIANISTTNISANSDEVSFSSPVPEDSYFIVSAEGEFTKETCKRKIQLYLAQHDDQFEISAFTKSSFEWSESNYTLDQDGFRVYTDGTYGLNSLNVTYVRKPVYMHNAYGFSATEGYELPGGQLLTGTQDCDFPANFHYEIVDLAVALIVGTYTPTPELTLNKLSLTN